MVFSLKEGNLVFKFPNPIHIQTLRQYDKMSHHQQQQWLYTQQDYLIKQFQSHTEALKKTHLHHQQFTENISNILPEYHDLHQVNDTDILPQNKTRSSSI